jgi:hypothetical protein
VNQSLAKKQETFSAPAAAEIVYRVRDVVGIAQSRVAAGLTMAARLRRAGMAVGSAAAQHRAYLIEQCAAAENVWVAQNLDAENPESGLVEMFDGVGVLSGCGSRFCPSCCADLRRRSRRRARAGLAAVVLEAFEAERCVTLTTPTCQRATVLEANSFINGAFRRLSKKSFWRDRVRGAIKGVEFTLGALGYHAHIHLIVISKFIERDSAAETESVKWRAARKAKASARGLRVLESLPSLGNLQSVWESCLLAEAKTRGWLVARSNAAAEAAAAAGGVWLDWRRVEGIMVDVRSIRSKRGGNESETISQQDALNEVLKYATKGSDWLKLPDQELVEAATVKRWSRMFEVLGACKPSTRTETVNVESAKAHALLDTPYLSAAETSLGTGSERENESGESETYIEGAGWVAAESAHLVSIMYNEEEWLPLLPPSPAPAPVLVPLPRAELLLKLAETMPFDEWCVLVEARLSERRFIRRRLLAQQFEHASFWALSGRRWGMLPGQVEEI